MQIAKEIAVKPLASNDATLWKQFLLTSNNGTLFHDLDFLNYHPKDKFEEHHLLFYEDKELIALLPAAIINKEGRKILSSPYAASIGGLVLKPNLKITPHLHLVKSLQDYALTNDLQGIEFRLGPTCYQRTPNQYLEFALMKQGFQLNRRWLSFIISLENHEDCSNFFNKTKRYEIRTQLKAGVSAQEAPSSFLTIFYDILQETMLRHQAHATHNIHDLEFLMKTLPGKCRIFLCEYQGIFIAGVLLFMLNDKTAYTYYFCEKESHKKYCGPVILVHHIMEILKTEGVQFLDLGPSASSHHFNEGVIFFKEGVGGIGFCRDEWIWCGS